MKQPNLLQGSAGVLATRILGAVLQLFLVAIVAIRFEVSDVGMNGILWTAAVIFRVCGTFGLDMIGMTGQTFAWNSGDAILARALARRDTRSLGAIWLLLLISGCATGAIILPSNKVLGVLIVAMTIASGASAMQRLWTVQLVAQGRIFAGQTIESVMLPALAIVGALASARWNPASLLWTQAVAFMLTAATVYAISPAKRGAGHLELPPIAWRQAYSVAFGAGLTAFAVRSPMLLLGAASLAAAGVFDVAQRIQSAGSMGVSAVTTVLLPRISAAVRAGHRKSLMSQLLAGAGLACILPFVLLVGLWAVGPNLLGELLGAEYQGAWLPAVILLAAATINACTSSLGNLMSLSGHGLHFAVISGIQFSFILASALFVDINAISMSIVVVLAELVRSVSLMVAAYSIFWSRKAD